jgi:hypothetical protein
MQARKLITYHFFCLLSFETHGITSVARLQREEVSRLAKEHEELVHFLQESMRAMHPLLNFADDFDLADHTANAHKSTGSTASFKTHGKCMANLIQIDRQWGTQQI